MKLIHDQKTIETTLNIYHIQDNFQTNNLEFFLAEFEKGEDLNYQLNPEKYFLFFLKGQISIRHINEEGMYIQIARIKENSMLGDMEFVHPGVRQYLIEVEKKSLFVALSLEKYRSELLKDPVFLLAVARSIEEKMEKAEFDINAKEKLPARFQYYIVSQKDHTIHSVNETCEELHCSRRQLQRVLHDLCEKGVIVKKGKGTYKLN